MNPCEVTVHVREKKKKIKKGRKRRRDETRYPNTHYQVQNQDLNLGGQKHESKKFQMT